MTETIVVWSNKAGLKDFLGGWTKIEPDKDSKDFFFVTVTKEQYNKMKGSEFDPWV